MEMIINIPSYDKEKGINLQWSRGFTIKVKIENDTVLITANKEGLESLANHMLNLAQDNLPSGYHVHLDESNSLEDGSAELVIEKFV